MKKIFLILIIFIIQFSSLVSKEPKLEEILNGDLEEIKKGLITARGLEPCSAYEKANEK